MLGFFSLVRRLRRPSRPRSRRITLIESSQPGAPVLGPMVASVCGWRHVDLRGETASRSPLVSQGEMDVVISRSPDYESDPSEDGLTVCVDDVCDLKKTSDPTHCLRHVMVHLDPRRRT